jgi:O-acetyl-ADP-ribose deacetylase (regulator of RNase III)
MGSLPGYNVFPAISTGAYGYPLKEATEIAIRSVGSKPRI